MTAATMIHHPSRGPIGSTYKTQDGKVYCRTPFGIRLSADTGVMQSVWNFQQNVSRVIKYQRRIGLYGLLVGLGCGIALGLWVL